MQNKYLNRLGALFKSLYLTYFLISVRLNSYNDLFNYYYLIFT